MTIHSSWSEPVNLGPPSNTLDTEIFSSLSPNGLELYFSDWRRNRADGLSTEDLWLRIRAKISDPWGVPANLGPTVNSASGEGLPCMSRDGLSLYFTSNRPGGLGGTDIWVTTRSSILDPWTEPINLGPPVNTSYQDGSPRLSGDGSTLYFYSSRPGGYGDSDLWQVSIEPVVILDGKTESARQSLVSANGEEVVPEEKH
jgi:Tol biopolymer transport system component